MNERPTEGAPAFAAKKIGQNGEGIDVRTVVSE
jgi:hypothetical protein